MRAKTMDKHISRTNNHRGSNMPMTSRDVRRQFKREWRISCERAPLLKTDKPAMRQAFSYFVDDLARSGKISERVTHNATLDE